MTQVELALHHESQSELEERSPHLLVGNVLRLDDGSGVSIVVVIVIVLSLRSEVEGREIAREVTAQQLADPREQMRAQLWGWQRSTRTQ